MEEKPKNKRNSEIPLIPFEAFRKQAKNILDESKEKSDKELRRFQAANSHKREARAKKP
jgi:hypothetical protein